MITCFINVFYFARLNFGRGRLWAFSEFFEDEFFGMKFRAQVKYNFKDASKLFKIPYK
jgi:hypothetical protein